MRPYTTKIQLPDGRLLSISGHNAENVATILKRKLTENASAAAATEANGEETPLELPSTNVEFHTRHAPDAIVRNVPTDEESPLELPVMNFAKSRRGTAHRAPEADDDAPLEMPSTY